MIVVAYGARARRAARHGRGEARAHDGAEWDERQGLATTGSPGVNVRFRGETDMLFAMRMSVNDGEFNRSRQHLLILPDREVSDGGACTDVVHAEAPCGALGALEERSMRGGYRPRA